ncbi:MAG: hypothetical protein VX346_14115 [Planctomycetota bacterium]|nr:hypothetical protein [Planctomycetota bacterium]
MTVDLLRPNLITPPRLALWIVFLSGYLLWQSGPTVADQIVLRDLTILTDRRVEKFNEDDIRLDNGQLLGWDQIEKAQISADQARFNQLLSELGTPLYRIRQRLKVGDYPALLRHAETLYPRYSTRRSKTAYMVVQAVMWGRLAAGQRALAVEPYLRCYELLRGVGDQPIPLPGKRRLQFDVETGICKEFLPLWFDRAAATSALKQVTTLNEMTTTPCPAARLYQTALEFASATPTAESMPVNTASKLPLARQLTSILRVQREVLIGQPAAAMLNLEGTLSRVDPSLRPLAFYWLGRSHLLNKDPNQQRQGLLLLLKIAALHHQTFPNIAAAGLAHAAQTLHDAGDQRGSAALQRELSTRYSGSWHALQQAQRTDVEQPTEKSQ